MGRGRPPRDRGRGRRGPHVSGRPAGGPCGVTDRAGAIRVPQPASARRGDAIATLTLDDAVRAGFVVLAEEPGREIVLGVAGRFWTISGTRMTIGREDFARHAERGTAKAAMSFRVDPARLGRSRVVTETRVLCADATARRHFRRYWRVVRPGSALIRRLALLQIKRNAERDGERAACGALPER